MCFTQKRVAGATELSHLDAQGRVRMVDVGNKAVAKRTAHARAIVRLPAAAAAALASPRSSRKGDALTVAQIAGVMASKQTSALIPLCHAVPLDVCVVDVAPDAAGDCVVIDCHVSARHVTGVEMEALVGASTAALALYELRFYRRIYSKH